MAGLRPDPLRNESYSAPQDPSRNKRLFLRGEDGKEGDPESTMSKILGKLAVRRHVMLTGSFSEFQSVYRSRHSTETALFKVVNNGVVSACDRHMTVFLSLDISAAFDTIDHNILLDRISRFRHPWHRP